MPMHKTGKKNRKHGRNKNDLVMKAYKDEKRSEKNKVRKLDNHLKLHPNDVQSRERVSRNLSWYTRKKPLGYYETGVFAENYKINLDKY